MTDKESIILELYNNFSWGGLVAVVAGGSLFSPASRKFIMKQINNTIKGNADRRKAQMTLSQAIQDNKTVVTPEILNTLNKSIIKEKIESFVSVRLVDIFNMSKRGRPQSVFCLQIALLLESYLSHYLEETKKLSKHDRMDIDQVVSKVIEHVGYCKDLARRNIMGRHIPTEVVTIFSKWYEKHIRVMDDTLTDSLITADSIQSIVDSTLTNCIFFVNEVIEATDECIDVFNGDVSRLLPDDVYEKIDFSKYDCFYRPDSCERPHRF